MNSYNEYIEKRGQEMDEAYKNLNIEWHCPNRHGVLRNAKAGDYAVLVYFFGNKCAWKRGKDLEFVHMTKVSPPPRKPWQWCGTSVLFDDWHKQELVNQEAARQFEIGENVCFTHKGIDYRGIVANVGKRITVITGRTKFYVPATQLISVDKVRQLLGELQND